MEKVIFIIHNALCSQKMDLECCIAYSMLSCMPTCILFLLCGIVCVTGEGTVLDSVLVGIIYSLATLLL